MSPLILVASEEEKKALIPEEYHKRVILIGMGFRNVIRNLRTSLIEDKTLLNTMFINVGYWN